MPSRRRASCMEWAVVRWTVPLTAQSTAFLSKLTAHRQVIQQESPRPGAVLGRTENSAGCRPKSHHNTSTENIPLAELLPSLPSLSNTCALLTHPLTHSLARSLTYYLEGITPFVRSEQHQQQQLDRNKCTIFYAKASGSRSECECLWSELGNTNKMADRPPTRRQLSYFSAARSPDVLTYYYYNRL